MHNIHAVFGSASAPTGLRDFGKLCRTTGCGVLGAAFGQRAWRARRSSSSPGSCQGEPRRRRGDRPTHYSPAGVFSRLDTCCPAKCVRKCSGNAQTTSIPDSLTHSSASASQWIGDDDGAQKLAEHAVLRGLIPHPQRRPVDWSPDGDGVSSAPFPSAEDFPEVRSSVDIMRTALLSHGDQIRSEAESPALRLGRRDDAHQEGLTDPSKKPGT